MIQLCDRLLAMVQLYVEPVSFHVFMQFKAGQWDVFLELANGIHPMLQILETWDGILLLLSKYIVFQSFG